jgi:hypothetical protein
LARQYHPDGHVATDASEQARLSQVFAEIVEQHKQLATAVCR